MKVYRMTRIALMAGIICVLAPFSINLPISPVPVSLTVFAVYITVIVLGLKDGLIATCLYILMGAIGLPVFSKLTGGVGVLLGPTGGYIIGYIPLAFFTGLFINKTIKSKRLPMQVIGMTLGLLFCYAFGTGWLMYQSGLTLSFALSSAVLPFLPADAIKIFLSIVLGNELKKRTRSH